ISWKLEVVKCGPGAAHLREQYCTPPPVNPLSGNQSFLSVLSLQPTQIFAPSNTKEMGLADTPNVPRTEPSLARSFVTELAPVLPTQMFTPSNTSGPGCEPTL